MARAAGADGWLEGLPGLVAGLEGDWAIRVGRPHTGGSGAFVADATRADGSSAILKVVIPGLENTAANEATALRVVGGEGCPALYRYDADRGALLMERLGRPMFELGMPLRRRLEILCDTAARIWRPAPDSGLPTGAEKARYLADFVARLWEELDHPCSEKVLEHALVAARRRELAHRDEKAVLVHGDVHQLNALRSDGGFKLIDPKGLLAEAEYDLGVLMRGDPVELIAGDPLERARWLAARTGLDPVATWEWGVIERASSALLCTQIDLQPLGRDTLRAAEAVADLSMS
ncbi:aminoglycoside phosphotransferase family protein [Kribbella sp. NPDC004875]|uniref:aminoglycoside phosphotransferase family protein n=1 Tax=Kribbella sp. NPDC004875 TaxID=3364107 RepID=UPI0036BDFFDA